MAGPRCTGSAPLIMDIAPKVLDELCCCLDCLTDWEWLRFVSHVVADEPSVRRFLMKRRRGDGATRELMWSWGQKLAAVRDLERILHKLELYRALEILRQEPIVSSRILEGPISEGSTAETPMGGAGMNTEVTGQGAHSLPPPPPPPSDLLSSLHDDSASSTEEVLSLPQQEKSMAPGGSCRQWAGQQLSDITDGFSAEKRIFSGEFADTFVGRKADTLYAIKRIKEVNGGQTDRLHSFFQTEAQISFRCKHPNLLLLLGFCLEPGHRCLVTHFMKNGSLDAALRAAPPHVLSWEKRLAAAAGLLRAVRHLHQAGLLHGNIKSSNVFLDDDFSPKLGHAGPRFCSDQSANYTQIKTEELQRFQPYLPDTYLRRGQLTEHTDVFSAGVVLAEILTGFKSHDKSRDPAYLKDLIMRELEEMKGRVDSGESQSPEDLCAERIACTHTDARPGRPPGATGFYLAKAACLSLAKKKVDISEVVAMVEKAQRECQAQRGDGGEERGSINVPEESYFDDSTLAGCHTQRKAPPPPCQSPAQACGSLRRRSACRLVAGEISPRTPCELDESGDYLLSPSGVWQDLGTERQPCDEHPQPPNSRRLPEPNSPAESDDPSWGIEINTAKMQLMENIRLYEHERVDSSVLFDS